MMNELLSNHAIILFLVVGGLCLGFLIGFLLRGFLRREPKRESNAEFETKSPEIKPANRNWENIALLWRDRRDSRMIFQIENEYYKRGSELTPKEKKILLKIVMDFYQWLEPTSTIKSTEPAPELEFASVSTGIESIPLVSFAEEKPEPKRTSFNPVKVLTQALDADVIVSAIPDLSIVAQIDEILQEKLNAANMQKWAVRLVEFPNRGMVVMVGLEQYDEIDAIPYERVRKLIREAVAEWERRAER